MFMLFVDGQMLADMANVLVAHGGMDGMLMLSVTLANERSWLPTDRFSWLMPNPSKTLRKLRLSKHQPHHERPYVPTCASKSK